jgi:hypothetical protein
VQYVGDFYAKIEYSTSKDEQSSWFPVRPSSDPPIEKRWLDVAKITGTDMVNMKSRDELDYLSNNRRSRK